MNRRNLRHGFHGTRFYHIWKGIRTRTTNPNSQNWSAYGGKGITNVWAKFIDFKREMYTGYLRHVAKHGEQNTTIERDDNSEGYNKSNCRWATWEEQQTNKSIKGQFTPRLLTFGGKRQSVSSWARELGINQRTLDSRINHRGWSIHKALSTKTLRSAERRAA